MPTMAGPIGIFWRKAVGSQHSRPKVSESSQESMALKRLPSACESRAREEKGTASTSSLIAEEDLK
jgi:hypothetical protein